ncbi:MAG: ATP-dependent DNA helicase RecG [Alphaproteobacteria bacterium]|nr:ATP-dependent DNA helicase RecG [Alphaproteobacteria bacterium]
MRPEILNPLFAPVTALPGIGPKLAKPLGKLVGPAVVDLLWHLPSGLIDRRFSPKLDAAPPGRVVTVTVTVAKHEPPRRPRLPYRVRCHDDSGELTLVFFHAEAPFLKRMLPEGQPRVVSGKLEDYQGTLQMTHPDVIAEPKDFERVCTIEPVYPLTAGITPKVLAKAVHNALARAPELPDWLDPAFGRQRQWPSWRAALGSAHAPQAEADLAPTTQARQRLAYDELLANQLALSLIRAQQKRKSGRALVGDGRLRRTLTESLPFRLTRAQEAAIAEIVADLAKPKRMVRLLQGDVGSGKTVVALMAMLAAVEAGAQAALMAPTEILARQHLKTVAPLAQAAGTRVELLTGRTTGAARAKLLERIASGETALLIGTHALLEDDVAFKDLGLVVIDEQHRFGVHQRLALSVKGQAADVLVMTATPIPRTLVMTAYGDMDVSRLTEKPPGRKPIDTRAVPLDRLAEAVEGIGRALDRGQQVYWICPLVAESELVDLAAAEQRHAALAARFGEDRVGLVHGQQKGPERERAMQAFVDGETRLLVATTVIEVGVDVPGASVMVIEQAERFGLAQLHQLRGRVGRGAERSTCLLLYAKPLTETAAERLKTVRETEDGFVIAEADLRLRGAGEVLGTRQSGFPEFRLAEIGAHGELLTVARDDARLVIERDPGLAGTRGQALRVLLYLFERDAAVRLLGG